MSDPVFVKEYRMAEDFLEPGGMNLKKGDRLRLIRINEHSGQALCDLIQATSESQMYGDWEVIIPLRLIVEETHRLEKVSEKRLG